MGILASIQHAWDLFKAPRSRTSWEVNTSYSRPDRATLSYTVDRTIVSSIYNRIAVDVSAVAIKHARLDENGRFLEVINSQLNDRLNYHANKDQTGRDFIKDVVISLCDEGCVAIVPTHTDTDPDLTQSFKIDSMRVGKIKEWRPDSVAVELYNEERAERQEVLVPKDMAAIVENPFYEIMNCPNSSLQRLISKLNMLDKYDADSCSGKLDLIIQLPYAIRNDLRKEQAEQRRKAIEMQLVGSKYGIAYIDATEHITQLNRPAENNLVTQIENLTATVYNQVGLSENIMNGTAEEQELINYYNSTIEPFLAAICQAMEWKFISKTARTQGQAIYYYRDPFRMIPAEKVADIADKLTRNEILSPNELRGIIGYKPSKDPAADELRNRNINQKNQEGGDETPKSEGNQNEGKEDLKFSKSEIRKKEGS